MKMKKEELEKKLKRERVEVCLNCERFVECDRIGQIEPCHWGDFKEIGDTKQSVIVSLNEYERLKDN